MRSLESPVLPVAPVSSSAEWLEKPVRTFEAHEVDDGVLAALVRTRLALEKGNGWAIFACVALAVGSVFVFGSTPETKALLGVYAAVVGAAASGLGFGVERLSWRLFLHLGRAQGLSDEACLRVFERAAGVDRWIEILRSCGKEPTDEEIASFVCTRSLR
jgi:hypothetical protein